MGDCAWHSPPPLKITDVIHLELHDGAAAAPQRFYALEQLSDLAYTIRTVSQAMQNWREQIDQLMKDGKREQAFGIYQQLEQQRNYLVEQIRATRPFLMELEAPLAHAAQKLADQLAVFPLMSRGYAGLTDVLTRFADALPNHQTASVSVIGRLMNNVRMGHYPTDLVHVGHIARSISFPAGVTVSNWTTTGRSGPRSSLTGWVSGAFSAPTSAQERFTLFFSIRPICPSCLKPAGGAGTKNDSWWRASPC